MKRLKSISYLLIFSLCLGLFVFFPDYPVQGEEAPLDEPMDEVAEEIAGELTDEVSDEISDKELEEISKPVLGPLIADEELNALVFDVPRPEEAWPSLDEISAAAYIVADADTGEIILEHNGGEIAYPASMTKIMTALVVIEHPEYEPDRPIYFSNVSCAMPAPESSTAGYVPGEIAPTISLLYVMMTRSANEVANALAENYGGTIANFVDLMNQKAKELGCENTNFLDPCGFGYVDHHTTGEDMVKIIRHAMSHDLFRALVSCKFYSAPPTNIHKMSGWSNNFNGNYLLLFQDAGYQSPWLRSIDGIKTGHTDLAGDCLASAATTHDGRHLIAVIFNALYVGNNYNSYVGSNIMSRTLLEEGAKRIGSPRKDDAEELADSDYAWPILRERSGETIPEETLPLPSYTLAPRVQEVAEQDVDSSKIEIKKMTLALLIIFLSLFFVVSLILVYRAFQERKRKKRSRRRL